MPIQGEEVVSASLFWFTLSLVNAGLAQAKHRSGFLWWLASIFVGPLATLMIVVLPRGHTIPADEQPLTTTQLALLVGLIVLGFVLIGLLLFANR
jgi:hypothetical protein